MNPGTPLTIVNRVQRFHIYLKVDSSLKRACGHKKAPPKRRSIDLFRRLKGKFKNGFLRILKQQDGEVTAFSEKLWCGLLDYATAYADGRLIFTFKNSSTFEG